MPDIAGNSLGTATSLNLTPNVQTFPDIVTSTANDYYRFTLSHRSSFNLSLTDLSADANVALLTSTGSALSVNGVLQTSSNTGNLAESINTTLNVGTYYIRVATGASIASASYSLNISTSDNLKTDILWRNYKTGENVVWLMNGTTLTSGSSTTPVADLNWAINGAGDFNRDGQSDIVWRNYKTGENVIWLMNGTVFSKGVSIPTVTNLNWKIGGVGDFNSDGQADLVWRDYSTGENVLWLMNGTAFSKGTATTPVADLNWAINGVGDFNRDGKSDLVWRNYKTGENVIWLMNGTVFSRGVATTPVTDVKWAISGTGDFNTDGQADLLWRNYSTGENVIWLMNGTTFRSGISFSPVGDTNWRSLAPFIRTVEPAPINVAGNAFANAFNVGNNVTGSGTYRDRVSSLDNDYYQLNVGTPSLVNLTLTGLSDNLDVQLVSSSNQILQSSTLGNTSAEAINSTLDAGTYYVRVYAPNGGSSAYALNLFVDNLPVLVTNAGLTIDEGATASIGSNLLLVTDNDNPTTQLTYTLGNLPVRGGLSLNGAALSAGSIFTQTDITNNTLRYQHDGGETLTDSFTFTVSDAAGGAIASNTFSITVNPVNDAPILTVPGAQIVDQNTNSLIVGAIIADPDAGSGSETITIAAANGFVSLGITTGLTFAQGTGSPAASITASGTLSALNNALTSLIYRSNASFQGTDTISFAVNDNGNTGKGGALTDSKTIAVTVKPVNKPPVITVPAAPSVNEDTSLSLAGISISDVDAGGGNVTVSLSAVNGVLSLRSTAGLTLITGTGSKDRNLTVSGTLALINTALSSLSYQGNKDFNGSDLVSISVNDNGNTGNGVALSDTKSLFVTVTSVNDAPVLTVPAAQSVNESTNLQVTGISITDVDAASGAIAVSLAATNGKLSLGSTAGLSFTSGSGSPTTSLIFSGTLAAVNSALSTLIYQGNVNFNGSDAISINVNDNGNTGSGIALSDSKTIAVTVLGTNQAPVIQVPLAPSTVANTNLTIVGVSISDADAAGGNETVTIAAANGVLSLPSNTGLTFTQGTGNQNNRLTFRGTLAAINSAIGNLVYRSYPGFTGFDTITISVNDEGNTGIGTALSDTKTLFVNVGGAVNTPPTANADSYITTRNTVLTVTGQGVLANDTDPEGNAIAANLLTTPTNGSIVFNSNGTFTYTPNANYIGGDRFTYQSSDGIGNSNPATVNLTITAPANQAPTAATDSFTLSQNSTFTTGNVLTNDSDPDNNTPLTAQIVANPTQATSFTLNSNGTFTYIPTANFSGNDSFTYIARDALGAASSTATVNLSITAPTNQAPTAATDSFTLSQNSTFTTGNVLTNDSDPDNNTPLTAQIVANPTQATSFTLNSNGTFTYIPTANFSGNDSFTYIARDALGAASSTATVNLSITAPTNQAPTAATDSFTLSQNSTFTTGNVLTNDSDPDNNTPLTAQIVANPTQATSFTLNSNGTFTYVPTTGYSGNDSFTYVAKDALGAASSTATVNLSVTAPGNQSPTATTDSFTLSQNSTFTTGNVLTNDTDPDNNTPLTAQIVANPTQATSFTLNSNGTFTYVPTANFSGNDSFTYVARDALGAASSTATVNLSVTAPTNQAPTAATDSFTLSQNSTFTTGNVLTNDTDPDNNTPLTAQIVANPTQATSFTLNSNGTFTYVPTANFSGNDSFTYVARDALGAASSTATVNLSVTAPTNQAPTAATDSFTLSQNSTFTTGNVLTNDSDPDNNTPLTAQIVANPTQATSFTLNSNGTFTYVPTANFSGNDSFTYVARDALGAASSTATVNLSVTAPTNQAPTAATDSFTLSQNSTFTTGNVLTNDSDPDNNIPLTAQIVANPTQATSFTLNSNGTFTYIPTANFSGNDSFTYIAKDALGAASSTATVNLSITAPGNQSPTATTDSFTLSQNSTFTTGNVLTNDSDPDNNTPLTAQIVANPTQATSFTLNSNGTFTYIPTTGYSGNDSFTYVARDALGAASSTATVNLTVNAPANQAPTAATDSFTLSQNSTFTTGNVLTNDSDPDNNTPLTAQIVANPTQATSFTLNSNGTFTYVPTANFSGNDSFTYIARDAIGAASSTATVSLSVTAPTNQVPTAATDSFTLSQNSTFTTGNVLTNDSDPDNNTPLTAQIVASPTQATSFTLNSNGTFTYIPTTGYSGNDSFTYIAKDALGAASSTATVSLSITAPANQAPIAAADSFTLSQNSTFTTGNVLTNDSDPDNNTPLTAQIVASPTQATSFTLNSNGTFTYIPTTGYSGNDSFTYIARDALGAASSTATVSLSITAPANQAPIATGDSFRAVTNTPLTIAAANGVLKNDTDADSPTLTALLVSDPGQGSVTLNSDGSFVYTPTTSFSGTDTFVYKANDSALDSSPATVTLTVSGNTAPTASSDTYAVASGVPLTVTQFAGVLQNDTDAESDPLTANLVTTSSGSLTFNTNGAFVYTPNAGVTSGTDTFVYRANDGFANSTPTTVTLSIGTNAAPIAQNDNYSAFVGSTLTVTQFSGVLANDTDAQPLTASLVTPPGLGSVVLNSNGSFTYVPTTSGTDTFVYRASDGALAASATVTLNVSTATAPIVQNDTYQAVAGTTLSIGQTAGVLNNDSDTNGGTLTAQLVSNSSQGTVVLSGDGSFTYTPNAGVTSGTDTFVYRATNGAVNSSPATVTLSVFSDVRPVATNDRYTVVTNSSLNVNSPGILANDTDSDVGQTLRALPVSQPTHGGLLLRTDGSFVYTPDQGYLGADMFTYRVNDGFLDSTSLGTVSLSVATNAAPIATADSYSVNKNNTLIKNAANGVLKNDTDAEPLTASVVNAPTKGSLSLNSDGSFTYTPNAGVTNTTDTFVYRASDGSLSANATVTVTIKDTSAPPTAVNDTGYTVNANGVLTIAATTGVLTNDTDPDGDVLRALIGTAPGHGSVTLNADGSFVYTPTAGYLGADSFTYVANDGIASSTTATVSLTVGGANSPPTIAVPGSQVVFSNTDLVIQSGLSIGDPDAGANPVGVTLTAGSGNLTLSTTSNLTVSGNGSQTVTITGTIANINTALTNLVYHTVSAGFTGSDQIAIAVNDNGNTGSGGTQTTNATISVNVTDGPVLVKDINPYQNATATGTVGSTPSKLTAAGNKLFFVANDGSSGVELWSSDGTSTNTNLVADINTTPDGSASSNPSNLTVIGNTLYFTADNTFRGTELWKADLTGATAPSIVKDIRVGSGGSSTRNLVNLNGTLYFEADDGSGLALWKTDGTSANTVKIETNPDYSQPGLLVTAGSRLYFTAGNGSELWRISDTGTQTTLLRNIGVGAGITNLVAIGSTLFFTASDSTNGTELWRSDGTAAGTIRISNINPGVGDANPSSLVNLNGTLYFFAKNGSNVYGLWQSTAAGVVTSVTTTLPSAGQAPTSLTVVGSKVFFVVDAGTSSAPDLQLWQSNGTNATLVKAINATGNDAVAGLTNVNGNLFFTANNGSTRLWKSDGTDAGTVFVSADFTGVLPHNLTAVGNRLFFTAETTQTTLDSNGKKTTLTTGEELLVF